MSSISRSMVQALNDDLTDPRNRPRALPLRPVRSASCVSMPPLLPRKRPSPEPTRIEFPRKRTAGPRKAKRETVSNAVEAATGPDTRCEEHRKFLKALEASGSENSSSDDDDNTTKGDQLQASPAKKRKIEASKTRHKQPNGVDGAEDESSSEEEGEDEEDQNEWDSFLADHDESKAPMVAEDADGDHRMEITVDEVKEVRRSEIKMGNDKKGPSKIERQIRTSTHKLHGMSLMYHNHVRNHWLNDKKLQKALFKQLSEGCKDEIGWWRKACGNNLEDREDEPKENDALNSASRKPGGKNDGKKRSTKNVKAAKNIRDWGPKAEENEEGNPDLSHGDPTLRLLKTLSAFWRKRFSRTAPGMRKQGYKSMERIQDELEAFRTHSSNQDEFGERIDSIEDLTRLAQKSEGSRDLGAQLFTALLRAVGLKARMVASLQPAGFGWSKAEEADTPKKRSNPDKAPTDASQGPSSAAKKPQPARPNKMPKEERAPSKTQPKRHNKSTSKGHKEQPIDISDSDDDSSLSDPPNFDSDESVMDVTPSAAVAQSHKRYDGDLHYPHYWTEVLSPITKSFIPVDPICLSAVASNLDSHSVFEPRGGGADRNRQVMAYVIAFNADGSAKDVTTRYLKRHTWPGKTKGTRYPIEKVPLYNSKGKIIRQKQYDWFKDVISLYQPHEGLHSAADNLEDSRELKPVHVNRNNAEKPHQESLQFYKNSADFVLERHLRREEALLPNAQPVKQLTVGKGDEATSEPVYKRSDVVTCKSSESWHKDGRQVKMGEQPLKRVPMRAVTALRKAEVEQTERETGVKAQQALFSQSQTEWIIPPPIVDGVIPKNVFNNIDVYVPTMVPQGAAHVPLRGTAKVCKKLGIDFAEACTGFEFGRRIAVPILTGVVVAAENRKMLVDAWREEEKSRKEKEKKKQERLALGMWRKMFAGLRVVERVRAEYGIVDERKLHKEMEHETKTKKGVGGKSTRHKTQEDAVDLSNDDIKHPKEPRIGFPEASADMGGGFLPEGMDVEIVERRPQGSYEDDDGARGFIVEEEEEEEEGTATPASDVRTNGTKSAKSLREQAAQNNDTDLDAGDTSSTQLKNSEAAGIEWTASQEGIMEAKPVPPVSKKRGRPSVVNEAKKVAAKSSKEARWRGRPKGSPSPPSDAEASSAEDEGANSALETQSSVDDGESDAYEGPPTKKTRTLKATPTSQARGAQRRRSGRLR